MQIFQRLRNGAQHIKRDAVALWFAKDHPQTPWYAKALGIFVVAYAFSPIDLIPDFIPVLGYLDDVLLLPALIWLTVQMLPPEVLKVCRQKAVEWMERSSKKPRLLAGAVLVVGLWIAIAAYLLHWV
jgi:uncharacterized membrane protein YkvA (DUF1232 family)